MEFENDNVEVMTGFRHSQFLRGTIGA